MDEQEGKRVLHHLNKRVAGSVYVKECPFGSIFPHIQHEVFCIVL